MAKKGKDRNRPLISGSSFLLVFALVVQFWLALAFWKSCSTIEYSPRICDRYCGNGSGGRRRKP